MLPIHQPLLAERARWAVALYADSGPEDQAAEYRRDRRAGIRRYKNAPAARLRADLEPVMRAYPDGTIQYAAAAYVLARYGVDVERNVERMFDSARMDRKGDDPEGSAEDLPEALGDLWVVRRSPAALHRLLTMPEDGAVGEIQWDALARVLSATPDAVLRAASKSKVGWQQLASSYANGSTSLPMPKASRIHERALLARLRRDAKRYE